MIEKKYVRCISGVRRRRICISRTLLLSPHFPYVLMTNCHFSYCSHSYFLTLKSSLSLSLWMWLMGLISVFLSNLTVFEMKVLNCIGSSSILGIRIRWSVVMRFHREKSFPLLGRTSKAFKTKYNPKKTSIYINIWRNLNFTFHIILI